MILKQDGHEVHAAGTQDEAEEILLSLKPDLAEAHRRTPCAGRSFAARMAGSLLTAVGLPELVTDTLADAEALGQL